LAHSESSHSRNRGILDRFSELEVWFNRLNGRSKRMAMLTEGQAAPPFALPNQDGTTVKLADLKGKNVIFWFYPRADTPG
jgi:AhpC/TSA family protein